MAKVDFYVLNASGEVARQQFACRLAEKAYRLDHSVHILAADAQSVGRLDDLLWTFRDGSFVPHERIDSSDSGATPKSPVTIGSDGASGGDADLLINLSSEVPSSVAAFPRIAEIVTADGESKDASRARFVEYRDAGHTLETHKL